MNAPAFVVRLLVVLACGMYAPLVPASDIQALTDEFDSASTLSRWSQLYQTEGWGNNQLETWDINTTTPGSMRLMPYTSTWFNNFRGVLVYKEITGDFIATVKLRAGRRSDMTLPPQRTFSLSGIFVRAPVPTRVASQPNPVPMGYPTWPPAGYLTDWLPGQENFIFLSYGAGGNAGVRQYEVKTTVNSQSQLYYSNRGVPVSNEIELQFVVVGQTAVTLRRHPGGSWVVENRYTVGGGFHRELPDYDSDDNPATPPVYQTGITAYTDYGNVSTQFSSGSGNDNTTLAGQFYHNYSVINAANGFAAQPDLIADLDYMRFTRPNPALTEAMLLALPVDYPNRDASTASAPLALLPGTGAGAYLGDNADIPGGPSPASWRTTTFGANAGEPRAALDADFDAGGLENLVEYMLGRDAAEPADDRTAVQSALESNRMTLRFTPSDSVAMHATLIAEASESLAADSWQELARRQAGSAGWQTQPGATIHVNSTTGEVTVTDSVASPPAERRFLRLRAMEP